MQKVALIAVLGAVGCKSDSGVKVFNASPAAEITSHDDGAVVKEATEELFRGIGSDPDHTQSELEGRWNSGTDVLCDWTPLDEEGVSECTVTVSADLGGITFLVRDPLDSVAATAIVLDTTPDADPQAEITSPSYDPATDEEFPFFWGDEPVEFVGTVFDDEDPPEALSVEWTTGTEEELGVTPPDSSGTTRASAYLSEGIHTVTLTVTDSAGNYTSDTLDIQVGPDNPAGAPDVTITYPEVAIGDRRFYYGDEAIQLEGMVTDDEDAGETLTVNWASDVDGEFIETNPDSDGTTEITALLSEGIHTITLTATDSDGQVGSDAINIEVGPNNTPPTCALLTPADGDIGIAGDLVVFGGTVSDPDIPVDTLSVEWKAGESVLGSSIPTSAGNVSLAVTELAVGAHVISMTATDEMGATCTDQVVYVVREPNNAPDITVASPATGDVITEGEPVLFDAAVSDAEDAPSDLTVVWSSDRDGVLSEAPADSSGFTRFTRTDMSLGSHAVTLTVTDTEGAYTTAVMVVTIEAAPDINTAPTVELTSPSDGDVVVEGDPVLFSAVVSDGEDALGDLTVTWTSSIDGVLVGAVSDDSGTVGFSALEMSVGTHIITVTVVDTGGLSAMAMAVLNVESSDGGGDDDDDDGGYLEEGDPLPPELEGGTYSGCADFDLDNLVIFGSIDAALFCACGFDEADNVKISSSGDDDIDLDCLDLIDGDLEIDLCGSNTIDLSNVASVGESINIHDNYDTQIIDMSSVVSVGGSFNISSNVDLEELRLTALETIDGGLQVNSNSSLAVFSAPSLTLIEGSLQFNSNNGIEEIALDAVELIEGNFRFEYNYYVESIAFPALTEIQGQLYMYSNDRLETAVFTNLEEVSSSLQLQYNYQMDSIDLASLRVVNGSVEMRSLNELEYLDMPALEEVNGSFNVSSNSSLDFLNAPAFYDLSGSLTIRDNTDLTGVDLSSLVCIEDFTVVGNNMTPEVLHELLLQLSCDEPGSEVIFRATDAEELCADGDIVVSDLYIYAIDPGPLDLSCIVDITGRLEIEFSDATTIDLSRAAGVGDGVNIHDNYDTDEIWLDSMAAIGDSFNLSSNISLSVLDIDALAEVGGGMTLNSNSSLETLYAPELVSIQGSVQFNSNNGMEHVELPNLYEVEGNLRFEYNYYVEDLLMPDLEEISGQLYFYSNDRLKAVDLSGLVEIGSSLQMQYNYQVEEVNLDRLETVNGSFEMRSMNQLTRFEMPALLEVNGSFTFSNNSRVEHLGAPLFSDLAGSLTIRDNTDLRTVDLSSLECIEDFTIVGNDLTIDSHHALLLALTCSSDGSLIIFRDTDADEFCATGETVVHDVYISPIDSAPVDLSCITEITGQVEIEFSKASAIDISNAASIGDGLNIHDNYDTETIDFTSLATVGESFRLSSNRDLETLVVDGIETIGGSFEVNSNGNLSVLSAPLLTAVEGSVQFNSNNGIEEISFATLTTIEGNVRVEYNYYIESLSLPALTEIKGQLYMYSNDRLETVVFTNLTEVTSSLQMQYNYQVESVDFSSLHTVNGSFEVRSMNEMEALNFPALTEVNGSFTLSNCSSVSTFSAPVFDDLSGSLTIRDNGDLGSIDLSSLTCVTDYTVVGNDLDDDDRRDLLLHIISAC